jgi:predicted amino acid-binding ACT domain protein
MTQKTRYEYAYVIDVMTDDHPGIVAAVGSAVNELSGNIDACSQTVLSGYFTLIMVISLPEPLDPDELAERVRRLARDPSNLQVMAQRLEEPRFPAPPEGTQEFVLTAFGADRPGFLLQFSRYLAGKDINITDLYGRREGDDFVLISQVQVPARWDIGLLQADLEEMGRQGGFTVRFQHENIFVATNQLSLRAPDRPDAARRGD